MLNENLITKHFKALWKSRIFVERQGDQLFVTDTNLLIRLPDTAALFNDRAMFPELPEDGESFTYSKQIGFNKNGPKVYDLIKTFCSQDLKPVTLSKWFFNVGKAESVFARLLYFDTVPVMVNQSFLNLFNCLPFVYGTGGHKPIIVFEDETTDPAAVLGAIMPVKFNKDTLDPADKFPRVDLFL